jgi:hypothetical protein
MKKEDREVAATALGVLIAGWENSRMNLRVSVPRVWEKRRIDSPLRAWLTAKR